MSIHLFKSINGRAHPSQQPATPDDLAADLALDMIERIKARRLLAQQQEANCEASVPWSELDAEAYQTLEALIGTPSQPGRHRKTVLRLLFEHFPELIAKMKVN